MAQLCGKESICASSIGFGAHWRAVVEKGAQIPLAVPRVFFDGFGIGSCALAKFFGEFIFAARFAKRGEFVQHIAQEPRHPHAFAFAVHADAVEAIVPIAGANERQIVRAVSAAFFNGAAAMLKDRGALLGNLRLVVNLVFVFGRVVAA